ncbi:hypothetical protein [Vibrio parahaemolyticus]|uniref:hypothetical protein n=1 Tax=Vibrio parahaemolyticus TaxID=670 RepID=UPI0025554A79|nr:hypothetical protein [Vibrio parahaemolyticus]
MFLLHRKPYYVWLGRRIGLTKLQTASVFRLQRSFVEHYWGSTPPKSARDALIEEFVCGGIDAVLEGEIIEDIYHNVQSGFYRQRTVKDVEEDIDRKCMRLSDDIEARLQGLSMKCLQKLTNARQRLSKQKRR